ncbi:type I-C CRISPR-associated protein Cas8c/Csd1 [Rubinisphaera brasiliensis]|uniref:CRISPR-associated protein, Csd1 family n=1 Tax=Rubinisphaera brasiliensis (strain ATCC 49424 / DSM 5305 / JCM 21570 / IAM 15109 / NBRC 103401 / IFAM 1448) TaxID=756272 RepID=F0SHD6_RUBBR|nr:type I-C CRISPR-associated protein Cas8c/Csd1 [Rubinisphaera brasiliensis]ADY61450.1 CRISPR-associated protein, Csd1 family [Rubinisphaera brasiliensis DSM 5305]ADY61691.1 CRISPR-associated protein, Csd1 family [Rubinisphaera brasiliensis DSM 5305]
MILQALNSLYSRLENDPETQIAPFGYSPQKIVGSIVIDRDGQLIDFVPQYREEGKKRIARTVQVCGGAKPSGSGINPCFLWDNPAYLLGYKPDDTKPERTREAFEASRQLHLSYEKEIDTPDYSAVCRFLENWNPDEAANYPALVDNATGFFVFQISGKQQYAHQNEAIKRWWNQRLQGSESEAAGLQGICLVTGETQIMARLHEPKIKGVRDAQAAGAALVSFNANAYESYGKSQSYNAPVSEQAAFQYCTALNYLLARENNRSLTIGDATVVYWSEEPTPVEDVLSLMFSPPVSAEDASTRNAIAKDLELISQGLFPPERFGNLETRFYVLGLSPNAARLSVRFWYVSTLREMLEHLQQHMQDLQMCGKPEKEFAMPAVWQLTAETARESKDVSPLLAGAVMKAILTGQPYPEALYSAILRRLRMDRNMNYRRACILKACLNRNHRLGTNSQLPKEVSVSLDPEYPDAAYHMGRLFAELEKSQEDALPGLNATIKDRFFGAASATPASVFPRLIRMNQHHLSKLEGGSKHYHEKRIQEICQQINTFPSHLQLHQQGLFALGYYHQRADIFTKKEKPTEPEKVAAAE